ncbi:efflux RND transporter periplasmic adaptor subunit [Massilia sp. MB5]|uniref:efflux RND transporter periplasmic adaptor subunit n=1 Tax=Massilia sp. MB5 TaxID=2919578 RepID=UPI001F11701A|nr:efflux RND transporter periplasmic adaptor subunit [Massilia sp. MB5]UMR29284.1 efflux RND transporter periplasmic adaptor subunit [Massilia sp. MB5]
MPHSLSLTAMAAAAVLLAACSKPAEKSEDIRPVRAIVLHSSDVDVNAEFSGEVRPRVESRLGFRVGGKIISRKVDVGTPVKRGQVLMQLDPQDLKLAQTQALASLRAAETNRDFALAELKRYQELREKNFVSQAILDSKSSAYKAAEATVDSSKAVLAGQANQTGYSTLEADIDGVVTAVDAEVGQVVAPGTPVVRVAKSGEKEIVIGVPEDKVDVLRKIEDVQVRLWANPNETAPGKIREVSPIADSATRTYTFKVTIPPSMADAKLGMTAVVQFASKTAAPQIKVPLTALFHEKSATSVWVVENGAVKLVPVTVGGAAGNELVLNSGVKAGQQVVTAGVHLLKPGQKVKVLDEPAPQKAQPQPNTKAAAGASK